MVGIDPAAQILEFEQNYRELELKSECLLGAGKRKSGEFVKNDSKRHKSEEKQKHIRKCSYCIYRNKPGEKRRMI